MVFLFCHTNRGFWTPLLIKVKVPKRCIGTDNRILQRICHTFCGMSPEPEEICHTRILRFENAYTIIAIGKGYRVMHWLISSENPKGCEHLGFSIPFRAGLLLRLVTVQKSGNPVFPKKICLTKNLAIQECICKTFSDK